MWDTKTERRMWVEKNLKTYDTEELEKELERRKRLNNKPEMIEIFDFTSLKKMVADIIDEIANDEYREDNKQYIYEEVMKTFYGPGIFEWINSNT